MPALQTALRSSQPPDDPTPTTTPPPHPAQLKDHYRHSHYQQPPHRHPDHQQAPDDLNMHLAFPSLIYALDAYDIDHYRLVASRS